MRAAILVAVAAAFGHMLQGWDSSTIAGAAVYINKEFDLQSQPAIQGLILSASQIGGTIITICSGSLSDTLGRRPMLILCSVLYFIGGLIMLWTPNIYILLLGRLLAGSGVGVAISQVALYISEMAPSEIRGQLNTLPQFNNCGGMFLSYSMVFGMSLMGSPSWRLMLGVLCLPALIYMALTLFFLPESPRWLVSKGRTLEAKTILQRLRGNHDVSGELALLVEGLNVGEETSIEEYIIVPTKSPSDKPPTSPGSGILKLHEQGSGRSWIAKSLIRRSLPNQSIPLIDPIVNVFGSFHDATPHDQSVRSMFLPNTGSIFSTTDHNHKNPHPDSENQKDYEDYGSGDDGDPEDLHSPLLSRQDTGSEREYNAPSAVSMGSQLSMQLASKLMQDDTGDDTGEPLHSTDIGSGWQLAWKSSDEGEHGRSMRRIYLHQNNIQGSQREFIVSKSGIYNHEECEITRATALVSNSVCPTDNPLNQHPRGKRISSYGPSWRDLCEPGVRRALIVGVGLQILQQVSGINGLLFYTPQILQQAGVNVLLTNLGIGPDSAAILLSCIMSLAMLPCIALSMRLMDVCGRRSLLLYTIPILIVSLLALVLASTINISPTAYAVISSGSVMVYLSCFSMGFGAIPNILCAEIFPMKVRSLCITICALTYWIGSILIISSLPIMLKSIGIAGVFAVYALGCVVSWIFVFLKVPETKGLPLEVICEFFAAGAKKSD